MKTFIKSSNVGFVCLHFTDTNERIRFGIDKAWKKVGEETLSKVRKYVADELGPSAPINAQTMTELAHMMVEAAVDPDLGQVVPCRAYALMLAYGKPCFIIEAERAAGLPVALVPIHKSPAQADAWVDEIEASQGLACAIQSAADGRPVPAVAIPFNPVNPTLSLDDLAPAFPPEAAKAIVDKFASRDFQNDLSRMLATLATGRKTL